MMNFRPRNNQILRIRTLVGRESAHLQGITRGALDDAARDLILHIVRRPSEAVFDETLDAYVYELSVAVLPEKEYEDCLKEAFLQGRMYEAERARNAALAPNKVNPVANTPNTYRTTP